MQYKDMYNTRHVAERQVRKKEPIAETQTSIFYSAFELCATNEIPGLITPNRVAVCLLVRPT